MKARRILKATWLFVRWPLAVLTAPIWAVPLALFLLIGLCCMLVLHAWAECWKDAA